MSALKYLLILFVSVFGIANQEEYCYLLEGETFKHLGTKTPYRVVANKKDYPFNYEGCRPVKIVGVIRHGTRTPGMKIIQNMKLSLGRIRDEILMNDLTDSNHGESCEYNLGKIKKWKFELENEGDKILTHEGETEMIDLAKRLQNRFPSILVQNYSNSSFYFRFTDTQRTRESARFFTIGLFGKDGSKNVWFPKPIYNDPILRFYKLCDKWRYEIKKNPDSLIELNKYLQSGEVEDVIERVSTRIGLHKTISYEDIHLMYVTCSFETAWNKNGPSPWCSVFSKKDLKIMEYAEELKYYWRDGYGFDINHSQACPLINNIFSLFNSPGSPTSVFYFTHSGTILKTLSHLGLYKDEYKLTHDIQLKRRETRKWRVSKVDSFSSNLIFVLYRCNNEDFKVLLLHQERVIRIPGCTESDLCSLIKLEKLFSKSFSNCDFTSICSFTGVKTKPVGLL